MIGFPPLRELVGRLHLHGLYAETHDSLYLAQGGRGELVQGYGLL